MPTAYAYIRDQIGSVVVSILRLVLEPAPVATEVRQNAVGATDADLKQLP